MTSAPEQASNPTRAERWARYTRWLSGRRGDALMGIALFTLLVVARTWGVSSFLPLAGDQIRDWSVALRVFSDLPLSGPPSVAGGAALGPLYYWFLWLTRVTIGPLVDNLPHAGVYGLAVVHAAADVALFFGIRRLTASGPLALAAVLLLATAPLDLILSRTVWSPPLAVSFVKIALALFLVNARHPSRWRMAATVVAAWLAVQTHSSTILVALPLMSWFVLRELAARRWHDALQNARLTIELVLLLQVPYIIDRVLADEPRGAPTMIVEGVLALFRNPSAADPGAAFSVVIERVADIWAAPFSAAWLPWLLGAALIGVLAAVRRLPHLPFVSVLPLAAAVIGFAAWTRPFETYWFLGLAPAVALFIVAGACALPAGRPRDVFALFALGVVLYAQPQRFAQVENEKFTFYGPLVAGSKEIARRTSEIGSISTTFKLPPSTDPTFAYRCLGGAISRDADFDAVIAGDGSVTFRSRR